MMAGYLFARAGVKTVVLEKHGDFLRDFRGDTVHPSTLDLFDELGLLDRLLELPHDKVANVGAVIGGQPYRIADFTHLPGRGRFIALMPQWHFLDFLAREAARLPAFTLRMETEAAGLVKDDERVVGVLTRAGEVIRTTLVIAADGRGSILRGAGGAAASGSGRADRRPLVPRSEGQYARKRNPGLRRSRRDDRDDRPENLFSVRAGDRKGRGRRYARA